MARYLILLVLLPTLAVAEAPKKTRDDPMFDNRVTLSGSFAYGDVSARFRYDAADGTPGTDIDAEDDLGLKKHKVIGRGEVTLRPRPRQRLRLAHYFLSLDRHGGATLTRDIQFGDALFPAGDQVVDALEMSLLALNYSYSFWRGERFELAAGAGMTMLDARARISSPSRLSDQRQSQWGVAPALSLEGAWRFADRWYVEGRAQYLKISLSGVDGKVTALDLGVLYRLHRNVLLGAGYSLFDVKANSTDARDFDRFDLRMAGPQLFLRAGF